MRKNRSGHITGFVKNCFAFAIIWLLLASPSIADTIYTVKSGDNAWSIAIRFGVTLDDLYAANGWAIDHDPLLQVGQRIAIPSKIEDDSISTIQSIDTDESTESENTYTVVEGDCASIIADKLGIKALALLEYNGLTGEDLIRPGFIMKIPPPDYEIQSAFAVESDESEASPEETSDASQVKYEIQQGDCLWTIARRFHVGVQAICDSNGINQDSLLRVGSEIIIPVSSVTHPESRSLTTTKYTVTSGDTITGIATRFGVSQAAIMEANRLSEMDIIRPGMELVIPGYRGNPNAPDTATDEFIPVPEPARDYSNQLTPLIGLNDGGNSLFDDRSSIFDFSAISPPPPSHPDPTERPDGGWSVDGHFQDGTPYHLYTIRRGDTISGVSRAFDVTQSELMRLNGIDARSALRIGRDLRIPLPRPVINTRPPSGTPSRAPGAPRVAIGTGSGSDIGRSVVEEAVKYIGTPYVYAGSDPSRGADCSGYVMAIMTMFSVDLPHRASLQAQHGKEVAYSDLEPGDLVFFQTHRSSNYMGITHVGIYIGNGDFIHASSYRGGIVISTMATGSYNRNFVCARRMF